MFIHGRVDADNRRFSHLSRLCTDDAKYVAKRASVIAERYATIITARKAERLGGDMFNESVMLEISPGEASRLTS